MIKEGDIIGFSGGLSPVSVSINLLTYGLPTYSVSHVGIVAKYRGELVMYEALAQPYAPCIITNTLRGGTQAQRIDVAVAKGNGRVWHYPLYRPLYRHESVRLRNFLADTINRPYDLGGALRSGGFLTRSVTQWFGRGDDSAVFCSEWCTAALGHIGVMPTGNFSSWSPNRLCRDGRRKGVFTKPYRLDQGASYEPHRKRLASICLASI